MPEKLNGKYIKGKKLGEGAFAKVYLCKDTSQSNREVAIKQIDKQRLKEENMGEQMKREIALQKILKHENCVQLYEVFETSKHIYLVLELVKGGELFDKIVDAGAFDEDTGRKFFQQLICGLYYCHAQGVAHRDLKPENLLLDDKDNLKITDFGLSNFQQMAAGGDQALLQTVCGTPNYMAPEVLEDQGYCGFKADIWTSGVILYVMCAGALPFDDDSENLNALFRLIQRCDYRMPREFSAQLRDLIKRILVLQDKRLTMDQIINHEWFRKGFDMSQIEAFRGTSKIKVTDEQIAGAVKTGSATGERERAAAAVKTATAFSIVSELTGGALNALLKTEKGAEAGVRPPATRFFARADHKGTLDALSAALDGLKAKVDKGKSTDWELRCTAGPMQFFVMLQPTVAPQLMMVSVRKAKGDTVKFQKLYREMVGKLGEMIVSKSVSEQPLKS